MLPFRTTTLRFLLLLLLLSGSLVIAQDEGDGFEAPETLENYEDMDAVIDQLDEAGLDLEDGEYLVEDERWNFNNQQTGEQFQLFDSAESLVIASNITLNTNQNRGNSCGFYAHLAGLPNRSSGTWVTIDLGGAFTVSLGSFDGYLNYPNEARELTTWAVTPQIADGQTHHLLVIAYDKHIWVYVDGERKHDAISIFSEQGEFGPLVNFSTPTSTATVTCELESIYAYTWED